MSGAVPALSMVFMVISCMISIGFPIALFLYFWIVKKADIFPFFVGCLIMLLFVFVLESAAHRAILYSAPGAVIQSHVWLYAVYGGFMAGLFEETGRYLAFSLILRKNLAKNQNALMYGAGHGGFESIYLVGMTMINNLVWSFMINSGNTAALTGSLSGELLEQVEHGIQGLISTPSYEFLLGGIERIYAIIFHIALSVLVWFAVKYHDKLYLYPVAIFLHFAVDAAAVGLSGLGVSLVLIEAVGILFTAVAVFFTKKVWDSVLKGETL